MWPPSFNLRGAGVDSSRSDLRCRGGGVARRRVVCASAALRGRVRDCESSAEARSRRPATRQVSSRRSPSSGHGEALSLPCHGEALSLPRPRRFAVSHSPVASASLNGTTGWRRLGFCGLRGGAEKAT